VRIPADGVFGNDNEDWLGMRPLRPLLGIGQY